MGLSANKGKKTLTEECDCWIRLWLCLYHSSASPLSIQALYNPYEQFKPKNRAANLLNLTYSPHAQQGTLHEQAWIPADQFIHG